MSLSVSVTAVTTPAPQTPSAQAVDFTVIAPIVVVAVTAVLVLLVHLIWPHRHQFPAALAAAGLAVAGVVVPVAAGDLPAARATFCAPGTPAACSVQVDRFTVLLWALSLLGALIVVLLSWSPPTPNAAGEYLALLLAASAGVMGVAAARDLLTLLVSVELVTLPVVVMVALRGSSLGAEAAVKLFLLNTVGLGVSVFGVALVFGATGQVHLGAIADALAGLDFHADSRRLAGASVGLVLLLVIFALKMSLVPLHVWAPDTYSGAPVPVAAYLAVVSKVAGAAGVLLVLTTAFAPLAGRWALPMGVLAALTMTVGNVVALRQRQAVALLAWSSIAHAGWVVAPLAAAGWSLPEASRASLVYLLAYVVMTLAVFTVVSIVARARSQAGQGAGLALEDFAGLTRAHPLAAASLVFALACLAGLPPGLVGLFAKLGVFSPVVASGQMWLSVVLALNVVIALAYYLRWAAVVFTSRTHVTSAPEGGHERNASGHRLNGAERAALLLTLAAAIVFSVAPTVLYRLVG